MGLLQKACATYDLHRDLVGVIKGSSEPLSPCSHATIKADLSITVDQDGSFVKADGVDKKAPKIIIPVTEESSSRTGNKVEPHPLCEQLRYLMPRNQEHYQKYVQQLKNWADSEFSHPMLGPILHYVERGTIVTDLLDSKLIELTDGQVEKDKAIVRWQVVGLGEENSGPCWTNRALFRAYEAYYQQRKALEVQTLCMVSGEMTPAAKQHMKGVVSLHGNAKLISSNDNSNFTYRGRFTTPAETTTVGYEASQKAHNALRWLIANYGVSYGGRSFVCWEPEVLKLPSLIPALDGFDEEDDDEEPIPIPKSEPRQEFADYQQDLKDTLKGWQTSLPSDNAQAVIAAFDAATTGRLAVTYYNELMASDFLERLYDWDRSCCWFSGKFGIQSPSVGKLVSCAYGTQRGSGKAAKLVVDDKLLKQQIQRLISCRIDRGRMPADLLHRLVQRASTPQAYERHIWEGILFSACAAIRKYHYDQYKEEWNMNLEPDKKDRSYQYGRLLAVVEKAERDTYDQDEKREPNAIKMMSVFSQHPQYASRVVVERIKTAYLPRMKNPALRTFYDKLIQEIYVNLSDFDERELNRPLGDTYLMGYYLQRKALYTKKDTEN